MKTFKEHITNLDEKSDKLSSAEYQKAKKRKGFNKKDWKWNSKEGLYNRVNEDSKMARQSDSQLKDLMKKMRDLEKKDPKKPSTQHMIKRIEKEMKKRKLT